MGRRWRIVVTRQMRWGEWQSLQTPVFEQGVSMPRLLARMGETDAETCALLLEHLAANYARTGIRASADGWSREAAL